ncbi:Carbohydrate-selective porin [Roseibium alexandrii DFL-11]|uniref:Carbohydrate-selective porin n=2 Tax=Roseibium alexandrii TaxID=388408 RepID=A0A5E8GUD9_ROSAD|nr:Carbohydrate-selective porin [Roseibium alexandrii DFL-11]
MGLLGSQLRGITLITGAILVGSPFAFGQSADGTEATEKEFISILDVAPAVYYGLKRMPKFYGDPNMDPATVDGRLLDRQYLFGSLGGLRTQAAENGLVVDAGVTQVVQGSANGTSDGARYYGSADLWAVLDTGRAGLWSGGLIVSHLEGNWGKTVTGTGAVLPLNSDSIMPAEPSALALSELYAVQALPAGFSVLAGKVNFTGLADTNLFANNERSQFLYVGLNNNPILGAFVPYTSLGGAVIKQITEDLSVTGVVTSNNTNAVTPGFEDFGFDTMTYGVAATWTPKFGNLPGNYNALAGYTSKDPLRYDIDERYLFEVLTGQVPAATRTGNYALTLTASQYVWADESVKRSDGLPVGIGLFGRFGIAPEGRNVIDQFYSLGIGGFGGLFGRADDNWGIGWAGTHFSDDLRSDLSAVGVSIDRFEHAIEAYYNVAWTPAARTSLNVQYINSANPAADDAFVIGTRLQLDF